MEIEQMPKTQAQPFIAIISGSNLTDDERLVGNTFDTRAAMVIEHSRSFFVRLVAATAEVCLADNPKLGHRVLDIVTKRAN